ERHSSNAFWQAVDHVFLLPDSVDHTPLFARILETSQWRNQDPNWMDGVEPVERVREPARADDTADSDADADAKSAGHFSDNEAMVEDAEDTTAAPQAGPSLIIAGTGAALVFVDPPRSPRVTSRNSDGDASDEGQSTPRRRLGLEPQQSPAASSSSPSATSRRVTRSASHFARCVVCARPCTPGTADHRDPTIAGRVLHTAAAANGGVLGARGWSRDEAGASPAALRRRRCLQLVR
ncbi:hypothetical protein TRAPUB_3576, partial [Trametes pubescens]